MNIVVLLMIVLGALGAIAIFLWRQLQRSEATGLEVSDRLTEAVQTQIRLEAERTTLLERLERAEQTATDHLNAYQQAQRTEVELQTKLTLTEQQLHEAREAQQGMSELLETRFRLLANEVLEERTSQMDKRSSELLTPLREDLQRFATKIEQTYSAEARERLSLQEQIRALHERSLSLGKGAEELVHALKHNNKVQGNWGEMVLETLLEKSGLQRDKEYFVQYHTQHDGERRIPDIVLKYPNGEKIIIDSKVSLTDYIHYVNAETPEEQERYARQHLQSIRQHIQGLSSKDYELAIEGSASFVMMFIPNEPAYALAISQCPTLWEEAYRKHIILMNGTNLIAALRMALDLWQRDKQMKNISRIIDDAGKIYDAFVRFLEKFEDIERTTAQTQRTLEDARRTLTEGRGNIARRLEEFRALGLKVKRDLPPSFSPDPELPED